MFKKFFVVPSVAVGTVLAVATAASAEGGLDMATALGATATSVGGQITGVLPVVLPIFGALLAISIGLKVFKRITNKG